MVISFASTEDCSEISMPLDSEENSGEESKSEIEEDDDEAGIDHAWLSREQSSNSNLHFLYQEILFRDLELEVVVPPPKA